MQSCASRFLVSMSQVAQLHPLMFVANVMKAFPKVVQAYCKNHNTTRVKPEEVFDIVTIAGAGIGYGGVVIKDGFTASVTYGEPWQFQTALESPGKETREEALLNLLESTEVLLAEKVEDEKDPMDARGMVQRTGGIVDKALLPA